MASPSDTLYTEIISVIEQVGFVSDEVKDMVEDIVEVVLNDPRNQEDENE